MARIAHARRALAAVLAAVACSLTAVPQASAAPADEFPVGGAAMGDAWSTATAFWSQSPCGGSVTLSWAQLDDRVNAVAQWSATDQARPATYTRCSIVFNERRPYDYAMLCTVMTHEMGHLLGHEHAENTPEDVMAPSYLQPIGPCDAGTQTFSTAAPRSEAAVARAAAASRVSRRAKRAARARRAKARKARKARRSAQRRHRRA
jgi:hypothetical protein